MPSVSLRTDDNIAVITFDDTRSKVNVLKTDVMAEFYACLKQVAEDASLKSLWIESAKPGVFIAGADIREIESITKTEDGAAKARQGQEVFDFLEDLSIPTIALINGITLGGGLELALACRYCIGTFHPKLQMGLPEVKLGILPGFGGTWRLARRTGLPRALEMILQGKVIDGPRAQSWGLLDAIVIESELYNAARLIVDRAPRLQKKRPLTERMTTDSSLGRHVIRMITRKKTLKITAGKYPAPLKALDVVIDNYRAPRSQAMAREAEALGDLIATGVSKNLIRVFYLMERYKKESWSDETPTRIRNAGLLGAGVMGGGIAQLLAYRSIPVRMKDISAPALLMGLKSASKLFYDLVKKKRLKKGVAEARMGLISPTLDYSGFRQTDIVIEAVIENSDIKKKVLAETENAIRPGCVLATNTSAISIDELAKSLSRPERFAGMHFFNPVHKMPLVEIIRGSRTSDQTIATLVAFSRALKKTPIVVNDGCGFLVNRILLPFLNEAGYLLDEGGSVGEIDQVLLDFGMPMGAFILLDEIGLDVGFKVAKILEKGFGSRMQVAKILERITEKKWYGKKNKKGFYLHGQPKRTVNPELTTLREGASLKVHGREEIIERTIYVMINEAAHCLGEGICREPADVDISLILGTGFPPFRGGLLRYADTVGIAEIVNTLERLCDTCDPNRFRPSDYLKKKADKQENFYKNKV